MVSYQIEWEYSAGNTIIFKSVNHSMTLDPKLIIDKTVSGTKVVTDRDQPERFFQFTGLVSGDDAKTLHDVLMGGTIDYSGAYPRVKSWYWDGDSTSTNIEMAITRVVFNDLHAGWWSVTVTMEEKDQ